MKNFLVFILGMISGFILFAIFSLALADSVTTEEILFEEGDEVVRVEGLDGLTLFDQPGDVMKPRSYEVFQVIGDYALAKAESDRLGEDSILYHGMVVLLMPRDGVSYYDEQIIEAPKGGSIRQVGVYRYEAGYNSYKTVPAITLFNE